MTTTAVTAAAEGAATASADFESQSAGRLGAGRPAQLLAELFEGHAAMVLGICRGMLRHAHDAEDAAQQTFLSAYASLAGGTVPREPAAWLATIARNECRTRAHRRMREPLATGEELVDPADEVVRAEQVASLREALAGLPGQQRHAFLLREFSGLSYDELADSLGVTKPAVESLLFRARQTLRVSLRTAAASVTAAPAAFRDWVAQLFAGSPETPATAAKLASLGIVAKIAAATAGTALLTAGAIAVAPTDHRAAPKPEAATRHVARVHHARVVQQAATPPPVRVAAVQTPPAPVTTVPVERRHRQEDRTTESGDRHGGGLTTTTEPRSPDDGTKSHDGTPSQTQSEPQHGDGSGSGSVTVIAGSSGGGGPGPSSSGGDSHDSGDGSSGDGGGSGGLIGLDGGGSGSGDSGGSGSHDSGS